MKISYTYYSKTHRLVHYNEITVGEDRSTEQQVCEICGAWVNVDEIQEESEHLYCGSDKCTDAVRQLILIDEMEYSNDY